MLILPYSIVDCNLFFVHSRPPLFLQEKQHQTQAKQIHAPARLPRGGHLIEQGLYRQDTAKWAFKLPTPLPVSNGGSAN